MSKLTEKFEKTGRDQEDRQSDNSQEGADDHIANKCTEAQ
jgi:hypothetical protein